jgi:hypothetical protein
MSWETALTWEGLVALEPELARLLEEIRAIVPDEKFCANLTWRYTYAPRVNKLVGIQAKGAILGKPGAYALARHVLYEALPDCRKCLCN